MGVQHLWEILNEIKMKVKLVDMEGLTLAVDLATWICEFDGVSKGKELLYLKNLFLRIKRFLEGGILPVFVLDGEISDLKQETVNKRRSSSTDGRPVFNAKFKECCELLDTIGVPWIQAEYEAEALCAELNKRDLVDGVVTSDSDAFLYGAKTVYRNYKTTNGHIEKYSMSDVEEKLKFKQEDLIALGLLLGCDYYEGVKGIGKKKAKELLSSFEDRDALTVFWMWKEGETCNKEITITKVSHCGNCKHAGTKKEHRDSRCTTCDRACAEDDQSLKSISCKCEQCKYIENNKLFKLEKQAKENALKDPNFPNQDIINEFLKTQKCFDPLTQSYVEPVNDSLKKNFRSKSIPNQDSVCKYFVNKLEWTTEDSCEQASLVLNLLQKVKNYQKKAEDAKQRIEMEGEGRAQAGSNAGKSYETTNEDAQNLTSDDIPVKEFKKLSIP